MNGVNESVNPVFRKRNKKPNKIAKPFEILVITPISDGSRLKFFLFGFKLNNLLFDGFLSPAAVRSFEFYSVNFQKAIPPACFPTSAVSINLRRSRSITSTDPGSPPIPSIEINANLPSEDIAIP